MENSILATKYADIIEHLNELELSHYGKDTQNIADLKEVMKRWDRADELVMCDGSSSVDDNGNVRKRISMSISEYNDLPIYLQEDYVVSDDDTVMACRWWAEEWWNDTRVDMPKWAENEVRSESARSLLQSELCRRSLSHFIKEFWEIMSQSDALQWNWHLDVLCADAERVVKRRASQLPRLYDSIYNVPPGETKSRTFSIALPVWTWATWPWFRFITASYSSPLSLELAEKSRDIVRSEKYRSMYPHIGIKRDKDQKSNFMVTVTGDKVAGGGPTPGAPRPAGHRFSTSVEGTVTGFHGDLIVIDDPLDPRGSVSDAERNGANDWFDNTLPSRKTHSRLTPTMVVMQRLHEDDATGHLLKKADTIGINHIRLPGEMWGEHETLVKPAYLKKFYINGIMNPQRKDEEVLKEWRSRSEYAYAAQILQDPAPPGGTVFQVGQINIIKRKDLPFKDDIVKDCRFWDKAATERKEDPLSSFTCGLRMVERKDTGKFLIMDIKRGQWRPEVRERHIKNCARRDGRGTTIGIEQEPGSGGKDSAKLTIRNLAGFVCKAYRPTGDIIWRADPFATQVNEGNVEMLEGEWNQALLDELRYFPNATNDDIVSAGAGAFTMIIAKKKTRRIA